MKIGIVDYSVGNLGSLRNALHHVGATLVAPEDADKLVLPGVGHFGHCAQRLRASAQVPLLLDAADRGVPILGVCVGLQLLFEGSAEAPGAIGLGLLRGSCVHVDAPRLPIVGWAEVSSTGWLSGSFYFSHSFAVEPQGGMTVAWTSSPDYVAAVRSGGIVGVQFHPEKSGRVGLNFLSEWVHG